MAQAEEGTVSCGAGVEDARPPAQLDADAESADNMNADGAHGGTAGNSTDSTDGGTAGNSTDSTDGGTAGNSTDSADGSTAGNSTDSADGDDADSTDGDDADGTDGESGEEEEGLPMIVPKQVLRHDEPLNAESQMEAFFRTGEPPQLAYGDAEETADSSGSGSDAEGSEKTSLAHVSTELLSEAEGVLNRVLAKFGSYERYVEASFGPVVEQAEADRHLTSFLKNNRIKGHLEVKWVRGLNTGGKVKFSFNAKQPEHRKFTLWVASVPPEQRKDSTILRTRGIHAFAYHEIGTHLVRALNDGLQPWARKRQQFGLNRRPNTRPDVAAEEGLATLNTMLPLKHPYVWSAALLYYAAAKAKDMNFVQLFNHLERFVPNKEQRWKHTVRAKYLVRDNSLPGGYGRGQVYFEGTVAILRSLQSLDFRLLWSGRLNMEEVSMARVRRLARVGMITVPAFCQLADDKPETGGDWGLYRATLRSIGELNGILQPLPKIRRAPATPKVNRRRTTSPSGAPSFLSRVRTPVALRRTAATNADILTSPVRTPAQIAAYAARLSRPRTVATTPLRDDAAAAAPVPRFQPSVQQQRASISRLSTPSANARRFLQRQQQEQAEHRQAELARQRRFQQRLAQAPRHQQHQQSKHQAQQPRLQQTKHQAQQPRLQQTKHQAQQPRQQQQQHAASPPSAHPTPSNRARPRRARGRAKTALPKKLHHPAPPSHIVSLQCSEGQTPVCQPPNAHPAGGAEPEPLPVDDAPDSAGSADQAVGTPRGSCDADTAAVTRKDAPPRTQHDAWGSPPRDAEEEDSTTGGGERRASSSGDEARPLCMSPIRARPMSRQRAALANASMLDALHSPAVDTAGDAAPGAVLHDEVAEEVAAVATVGVQDEPPLVLQGAGKHHQPQPQGNASVPALLDEDGVVEEMESVLSLVQGDVCDQHLTAPLTGSPSILRSASPTALPPTTHSAPPSRLSLHHSSRSVPPSPTGHGAPPRRLSQPHHHRKHTIGWTGHHAADASRQHQQHQRHQQRQRQRGRAAGHVAMQCGLDGTTRRIRSQPSPHAGQARSSTAGRAALAMSTVAVGGAALLAPGVIHTRRGATIGQVGKRVHSQATHAWTAPSPVSAPRRTAMAAPRHRHSGRARLPAVAMSKQRRPGRLVAAGPTSATYRQRQPAHIVRLMRQAEAQRHQHHTHRGAGAVAIW